jgi:hypothetical protein
MSTVDRATIGRTSLIRAGVSVTRSASGESFHHLTPTKQTAATTANSTNTNIVYILLISNFPIEVVPC